MCGGRPTTTTSTSRTRTATPSVTSQTSGVTCTGLLGVRGRRDPGAPRLDEARHRRPRERAEDEGEREPGRDLGRPLDRLAAVDEGQLVGVQRVEDELE